MPGMALSAEDKIVNTKGHVIHSHDLYILLRERGNRARTQLLNIYLFLIGSTLLDSKYKKMQ